MKILFSTSSFGFLRNFQSTVRLLADRGHRVHLLAERSDSVDGQQMADTLVREYPDRITCGLLPSSRHRLWYALGAGLRASLDYWRYLDPRWQQAPKLRARGESLAPAFARRIARMPVLGSRAGLAVIVRLFRVMQRVLPVPPEVLETFRQHEPDLLLVTPLLYFRSNQVDHVRCAQQLGIPSVLGVGSWDHLTTKGDIHEQPDRVLVWNHAQRQEAIDIHGLAAERVVVTGAQAYDHWFATRPALDRDAFCRQAGLDPSRPFLLYLCSSQFIAPHEVPFVRRWLTAIRHHRDARLRDAGVLVRPHPQNATQWRDVDLAAEFGGASIWPRGGVNPIGGAARSDFFDSMYHAEAVVGVNTSAMIESGIIGRPVYSVAVDEFADTQEGTLHFQHLKNVEGGLLHLSATLDEHTAQLAGMLVDPQNARQSARRFIEAFIRPHGLEEPATPRVVDSIEQLAAAPRPVPRSASIGARLLRVALVPAAALATVLTLERTKLRGMILHWTRPARLAFRGLVSRAIYTWRFFRRLPRLCLQLAKAIVRRLLITPAKWAIHRAKMSVHAFLVWRKGEPEEL